jgi:hypothetical protein
MRELLESAVWILSNRKPRHYTKIEVLNWLVERLQHRPRTASK